MIPQHEIAKRRNLLKTHHYPLAKNTSHAKPCSHMATWLIRAGGHGEYEQKFLQENRVYVTWDKR